MQGQVEAFNRAIGPSYIQVNNVQKGLSILDARPDILFVFIPLQENDFLKNFTDNIRAKALCYHFSALFNDLTIQQYTEMFPPNVSLFTPQQARHNRGGYILQPVVTPLFNDIGGRPVDLRFSADANNKNKLYIHAVAVQSDNLRSINREEHRDSAIATINIYAQGQGLRYNTGAHIVELSSPIITMHRGTKHPLGEAYAVLHTGQDQTGPRANIAFTIDYGEPASPLFYG